jgi:hypothetical protein
MLRAGILALVLTSLYVANYIYGWIRIEDVDWLNLSHWGHVLFASKSTCPLRVISAAARSPAPRPHRACPCPTTAG